MKNDYDNLSIALQQAASDPTIYDYKTIFPCNYKLNYATDGANKVFTVECEDTGRVWQATMPTDHPHLHNIFNIVAGRILAEALNALRDKNTTGGTTEKTIINIDYHNETN